MGLNIQAWVRPVEKKFFEAQVALHAIKFKILRLNFCSGPGARAPFSNLGIGLPGLGLPEVPAGPGLRTLDSSP